MGSTWVASAGGAVMNYEYYSTLKTFDVEIKGNNNPENKRWNFWEFFRVEAEDAQDAKDIVLKWEPDFRTHVARIFMHSGVIRLPDRSILLPLITRTAA